MTQHTVRYGPYSETAPSVHCVMLAIGPDGKIPLVREFLRPDPLWKLPGGRSESGETPLDTMLREYFDETGLRLQPEDVEELTTFPERHHTTHLFLGRIRSYTGLKRFGEENGQANLEIELFRESSLLKQELLGRHKSLLMHAASALRRRGVDL